MKKGILITVVVLCLVLGGISTYASSSGGVRGYIDLTRHIDHPSGKSMDVWTVRVEQEFPELEGIRLGTSISTFVPVYNLKLGFIPAGAPDRVYWVIDASYRWNQLEFAAEQSCTHFLQQASYYYDEFFINQEFKDTAQARFSIKYHF